MHPDAVDPHSSVFTSVFDDSRLRRFLPFFSDDSRRRGCAGRPRNSGICLRLRYLRLMDGTSVEPLAQSVAGSTTNQMEGIEGEEQSAPKPAPPNQNPSEDATDKDQMEEEVILKRKRKKTSKIWDHLTIVTGNGTQKEQALCMYCKSKIYYDGTTSTCLRHLQSCKPHNDQIQKQQLLNFPPSMSSIDSGQKKLPTLIRPDKYDSNKMREAITTWVMGTEQPFSVVDDELYVNMMKTASPFFEKVSRTTIKEDCFKIYDHEKKRLKALLKSVSKISLTTDCWKSTHQKIEYMVVTGHFIDQNWRLQKHVLSFVHVPPPRGGNDIADAIYKCLKEWEIEEKIFTISVDNNASYNDKALKRLKEIFSRVRKLVCGGRLFHVRCCAHILNLLVRDGLGTIDSVIGEVREAIKYLNNSEARLQRFSDYAHQLQIKDRKLVLDVPTRWNSTYDMLFVALKFKDVFPRFAESDPLFSHLPIDEEWEHVECVCEILKVLRDCTTIISGSDYPTSNLYLIEVFRVKVTLDKGAQSENVFIRHMVTKMKEKFDKYWEECHLVMAIASVLDPRFKMRLVEFSFPSIYTDADKQIEEVKKALYMMYEEYLEIHDISVREATSPGSSCSGNTGLEKTPLGSGWEAFGEFIKNADLEKPEKSELDTYLEKGVYREQGQKGMDSFKALEWWCVHKEKYRVLSKMAMDVLAIPVSTVASESTFSAGGRVIDAYHSSLGKETVQKLICGAD
ncbi:hypothetical protein LXL04_028969 [Taraxacum kok-saghyz]